VDDILTEVIRLLLTEEFIGQKGGVNYYQMGGSIKRPELYNLDTKGKPTRSPGVPGLGRSKKRKSKKRK
jgi:hypothetical protein